MPRHLTRAQVAKLVKFTKMFGGYGGRLEINGKAIVAFGKSKKDITEELFTRIVRITASDSAVVVIKEI